MRLKLFLIALFLMLFAGCTVKKVVKPMPSNNPAISEQKAQKAWNEIK